jgi:catechol 2,3-dioxygenase-like lactoylglutathione lyase family enzyme
MDWKIELIPVPVTDVDRAKRFYAEQLAWTVDVDDAPAPGIRLVQLTPPGSACSIVIGTGVAEGAPGSIRGVRIVVADIQVARDELIARDVACGPIRHWAGEGWADGKGGRWNSFVTFDDPDGNGWELQEAPPAG